MPPCAIEKTLNQEGLFFCVPEPVPCEGDGEECLMSRQPVRLPGVTLDAVRGRALLPLAPHNLAGG